VTYTSPEVLQLLGPLVVAWWSVPPQLIAAYQARGRPITPKIVGHMLVDTGADVACIDAEVAQELGLVAIGRGITFGAHGQGEVLKYVAHLALKIGDPAHGEVVISSQLVAAGIPDLNKAFQSRHPKTVDGRPIRLIGLLGRDLLRHGTFTYQGTEGRMKLRLDIDTMGQSA